MVCMECLIILIYLILLNEINTILFIDLAYLFVFICFVDATARKAATIEAPREAALPVTRLLSICIGKLFQ